MSFTWSNLLSSKLGLCRNGKFSHMSARYDFSCLYSILSIYRLKREWGWGVRSGGGDGEWGGGWKVGGWGVGGGGEWGRAVRMGSANTTVDEALACHHQCGLGSSTGVDATSPWLEFAAGFLPFSERFLSGFSSFPLSSKDKNQHFKFQSDGESVSSKLVALRGPQGYELLELSRVILLK